MKANLFTFGSSRGTPSFFGDLDLLAKALVLLLKLPETLVLAAQSSAAWKGTPEPLYPTVRRIRIYSRLLRRFLKRVARVLQSPYRFQFEMDAIPSRTAPF